MRINNSLSMVNFLENFEKPPEKDKLKIISFTKNKKIDGLFGNYKIKPDDSHIKDIIKDITLSDITDVVLIEHEASLLTLASLNNAISEIVNVVDIIIYSSSKREYIKEIKDYLILSEFQNESFEKSYYSLSKYLKDKNKTAVISMDDDFHNISSITEIEKDNDVKKILSILFLNENEKCKTFSIAGTEKEKYISKLKNISKAAGFNYVNYVETLELEDDRSI